jgi:hypothetical protein
LVDRDAFKTHFNAVKIMSGRLFKNLVGFYFFCLVFFLSLSPLTSAQQKTGSEEPEKEASASQAQATLASLFGRGAKMTAIPRISGTIALPVFDGSEMTINEGTLRAVEQQKKKQNANDRSSEPGGRNSEASE